MPDDFWEVSRNLGRFRGDRRTFAALIVFAIALAGWAWLRDHPQHDPWAPLDLRDPTGCATAGKLAALSDDPQLCRGVFERSEVDFTDLPPAGEGPCRREDRLTLDANVLAQPTPVTTCPVALAMHLWLRDGVQPAAQAVFGTRVASVEHFGSYSCRRLYGRDEGPWSEHATGNALDIAGFVLDDGRRISVLRDWSGEGDESTFLRAARDAACEQFSTVLSPEYNEAHRDHFHFDRAARRIGGVCR